MINLLPLENKEELKQEGNFKVVTIVGILVLVSLVCFFLILLSIKEFISGEIKVQQILISQKEAELKTPQMQVLETNLVAFNQELSGLKFFYKNRVSYSRALEIISATIPSGIYLTNLSLVSQSQEKNISCNLSGFSPDREKLIQLKENLEKEKSFKEVVFPTTNWVKATDVNFTVSFKLNEN
jgi:Tfp pilus assembly protein PilN